MKKETMRLRHTATADSNGTSKLSKTTLQENLDEVDLNLADIQQMVEVGIRATQDLRRGNDPSYYRLPAGDSEMLTFSLFDLRRRVENLRAWLSSADAPKKLVKVARSQSA